MKMKIRRKNIHHHSRILVYIHSRYNKIQTNINTDLYFSFPLFFLSIFISFSPSSSSSYIIPSSLFQQTNIKEIILIPYSNRPNDERTNVQTFKWNYLNTSNGRSRISLKSIEYIRGMDSKIGRPVSFIHNYHLLK